MTTRSRLRSSPAGRAQRTHGVRKPIRHDPAIQHSRADLRLDFAPVEPAVSTIDLTCKPWPQKRGRGFCVSGLGQAVRAPYVLSGGMDGLPSFGFQGQRASYTGVGAVPTTWRRTSVEYILGIESSWLSPKDSKTPSPRYRGRSGTSLTSCGPSDPARWSRRLLACPVGSRTEVPSITKFRVSAWVEPAR